VWEIIQANKRKSFFLALLMAGLLMAIGAASGEYFAGSYMIGLVFALVIWMFLSILAYFQGRTIFLSISGARKIEKKDHPRLFNIVEEMTISSALPAMPDIYIIDDPAPNAFAVGRRPDISAVAVTSGLLNVLNRDELQGVVAHEIGHIINRDTLFMSMLGVMLGTIVMLAEIARRSLFFGGGRRRSRSSSSGGGQVTGIIVIAGLILMIVAPLLARIIYLAASRKREYLADASAAVFTRLPEGLASALEKISVSPIKMRKLNQVTAPMFIINPLQKLHSEKDSLFSTHPSTRNRVSILRSMAGGSGFVDYDQAYRRVTQQTRAILPPSALKTDGSAVTSPAGEKRKDEKTGKRDMARMATRAVLIGSALKDMEQQAAGEPESHVERVRETGDALWKSQGYSFIACDCGAVLKVPPDYKRPDVICLRCHRTHANPSGDRS
jgi:heat shock protein HtpX